VVEFILTKTSSFPGLFTIFECIRRRSSDCNLITHVDVSVVPVKTFVEFAINPNGSNKCALNINDEVMAPFVCVNVHFPVSAPERICNSVC